MYEKPLNMFHSQENNLPTGGKTTTTISSQESPLKPYKRKIEENLRTWLARLPEENDQEICNRLDNNDLKNHQNEPTVNQEASTESADLYSFYRELCALRHEFRKSIHRNHDSTSHFTDKLENFAELIQQINQRVDQQNSDRTQVEIQNKRQFFLPLVDIYERFLRLQEHLQTPLKKSFWQSRQQFSELKNEREKLSKGLEILEQHFLMLLEKEGVQRQVCQGEKFDPTTMTAVEVVNHPEIATNEVVEEISAGYNYHTQTLKLAEVIVNQGK